jgi:hypothetical protein
MWSNEVDLDVAVVFSQLTEGCPTRDGSTGLSAPTFDEEENGNQSAGNHGNSD